eukprot:2758156-Prymnesium_polylepis.1
MARAQVPPSTTPSRRPPPCGASRTRPSIPARARTSSRASTCPPTLCSLGCRRRTATAPTARPRR